MTSRGHCLCGAVNITIRDLPTEMHACHCENCRRTGLIGFTIAVPAANLAVEGQDMISLYDSSEWGERAFCSRCGSNLWFQQKVEAADYYVSPGLLDDLASIRLVDEIFIDRKPKGYALAGETRKLTGDQFYKMIADLGE